MTTDGDSRRAMRARHKRVCKGKAKFPTMRAAELFAKSVRTSERFADPTNHYMDAYRCLHCGSHHVGHKPFVIPQDGPPERKAS